MKFFKQILAGLAGCLLTVLLVTGCDSPKQVDNFKTFERTEIKLRVELFESEKELNKYIVKNFNVPNVARYGFARWYLNDDTNECTVYLVRGTKDSLQVTYGHELMHCIYGSYHKE